MKTIPQQINSVVAHQPSDQYEAPPAKSLGHPNRAVAEQLAELTTNAKGERVIEPDELDGLLEDTQLVVFFDAMSARTPIATESVEAYFRLKAKFGGFIKPFQGGLTDDEYMRPKCAEVREAAAYHRWAYQNNKIPHLAAARERAKKKESLA
jgi:hypothetical protein